MIVTYDRQNMYIIQATDFVIKPPYFITDAAEE
jgi:hypothetical protein